MAWQDNLLPGSFRGVAFFYRDVEIEGGRRASAHEFPYRDTAYVEDLGKKNRSYRLQAYVLGDDYFAQRAALLAALEMPGPGTLSHPYYGILNVQVTKIVCRDLKDGGRESSFDLEFVDAGSLPSPTSVADTAGASLGAGGAMNGLLGGAFGLGFNVGGFAPFVAGAASLLLGNVAGSLAGLLALGAAAGANLTAGAVFLADLAAAGLDAALLAAAVTGFTGSYAGSVVDAFPPYDDTLSSRGPAPVADPSYGLAALANWGSDLPPVIVVDTATQQMADNQAALLALVRGAAITGMATLYASTGFASANDAGAARDQLTGLIDAQTFAADADGDTAGTAGWTALYAAAATDLTVRGKGLPHIATYSFGAALPALYLSQRLYQSADDAGDLIARNAAPHPLFMPMTIEALVS
jgi:prophage DNA circulation protein